MTRGGNVDVGGFEDKFYVFVSKKTQTSSTRRVHVPFFVLQRLHFSFCKNNSLTPKCSKFQNNEKSSNFAFFWIDLTLLKGILLILNHMYFRVIFAISETPGK